MKYPWWASLYLNLVRVETESVDTMAVDGTHLFFNPTFTVKDLGTNQSLSFIISITVDPFAITTAGVLPNAVAGSAYNGSGLTLNFAIERAAVIFDV